MSRFRLLVGFVGLFAFLQGHPATANEQFIAVHSNQAGLLATDIGSGEVIVLSEEAPISFKSAGAHIAAVFDSGLWGFALPFPIPWQFSQSRPKAYNITKNYLVALYQDGLYAGDLRDGRWARIFAGNPDGWHTSEHFVLAYNRHGVFVYNLATGKSHLIALHGTVRTVQLQNRCSFATNLTTPFANI